MIGYPRSGTTILGNLLGQLEGFFHAGELRHLWTRSFAAKAPRCGCGRAFSECALWSSILLDGFGLVPTDAYGTGWTGSVDPARVAEWQRRTVSSRRLPWLLGRRGASRLLSGERRAYAGAASRLYRAIAEHSGSRVIVDSSKLPADGALAAMLPGVETYFLHVVRDPRATLWSRLQKGSYRKRAWPLSAKPVRVVIEAVGWRAVDAAARSVCRRLGAGRSLVLRYEDFVHDPRGAVQSITKLLGEDAGDAAVSDEGAAWLEVQHTVTGNRSRFQTGAVDIREDLAWTEKLKPLDVAVLNQLTGRTRRRYGYSRGRLLPR